MVAQLPSSHFMQTQTAPCDNHHGTLHGTCDVVRAYIVVQTQRARRLDRPGGLMTCFCVTVSLCVCVQVKLWDVSTQQPALIATQDLQVGAVFGAAFCPEAPWLLAAGGAMGTVAVWDITTNSAVMSKYGRKLSRAVAAVASDDSTAAEQ